jgi:carbon storage regulator
VHDSFYPGLCGRLRFSKEEHPMLALRRKLGERILIPQFELTFSMVAIDGNTAKLGITAPSHVGIYREELWRKVRMEQGAHPALAGADPVTPCRCLRCAAHSRWESSALG